MVVFEPRLFALPCHFGTVRGDRVASLPGIGDSIVRSTVLSRGKVIHQSRLGGVPQVPGEKWSVRWEKRGLEQLVLLSHSFGVKQRAVESEISCSNRYVAVQQEVAQ